MEPILCSLSQSGQKSPVALTVATNNEKPQLKAFIEGGAVPIELQQLRQHLTPAGSSNLPLISHSEFVDMAAETVHHIFRHEKIVAPRISVSHPVYLGAEDSILKLVPEKEETAPPDYFQRMVFLIELPSLIDTIGKQKANMCVGGVGRMDEGAFLTGAGQRFQLFAGFVVRRCHNTCVFSNGLLPNLWVKEPGELKRALYDLLCEYDAVEQLRQMEQMVRYSLSEHQFSHLLGRTVLYQQLSDRLKAFQPMFSFTDYQVSDVAAGYLRSEDFGKEPDGSISLWKLYNLLLLANKSSHIDLFLSRAANAASFVGGIASALEKRKKHWFLG